MGSFHLLLFIEVTKKRECLSSSGLVAVEPMPGTPTALLQSRGRPACRQNTTGNTKSNGAAMDCLSRPGSPRPGTAGTFVLKW